MNAHTVLDTNDRTTRALLWGGALTGPLFTASWLVQGALRADYDPLRYAISSLAVGETGWIQRATFIVVGLLAIGLSIGLYRALRPLRAVWKPLLVGLVGLGLIGAGVFVTDPLNGYPPGTPILPTERTTHGILHDLFGTPVFLGLPITCLIYARFFGSLGKRSWAVYSTLSGVGMFAVFFVARLGFRIDSQELMALFGLLQRMVVTTGFAWLTLLAVYMLRHQPAVPIPARMTRN